MKVNKTRNKTKVCGIFHKQSTCATASPLRFRARQVMGPASFSWTEVMSKVWQPDSLTMILWRLSWHNLWPCMYHCISGGGRPPTRHCILKESFSMTSKSLSEVRKRGVSAWSSGSMSPLLLIYGLVKKRLKGGHKRTHFRLSLLSLEILSKTKESPKSCIWLSLRDLFALKNVYISF